MSRGRFRGALPLALLAAFAAGAVVDGWLRTYGPPRPTPIAASVEGTDIALQAARPAISANARDSRTSTPRLGAPPSPVATTGNTSPALRLPLDGASVESLKGGFAETRGGNRPHEAVDLLAPRNTPVHAVETGTIAKLFTSKAGGLTIYQFDLSGRLCYYYAHLERYADGITEGRAVSQGEVIGYVGTSGNAPPNTPHLHFAVFELNADRHWWQGKAIDPYLVFKQRAES